MDDPVIITGELLAREFSAVLLDREWSAVLELPLPTDSEV